MYPLYMNGTSLLYKEKLVYEMNRKHKEQQHYITSTSAFTFISKGEGKQAQGREIDCVCECAVVVVPALQLLLFI
jgi:hypothetical protein